MKKVLCTLLAVLLVIGTFSACSGNTESSSAGSGANQSTTSKDTANPDAGASDMALPYTGDETITIKMMGWESYSDFNWDNRFGQWLKEKLGNIEIVPEIPAEGTNDKINLYLTSGTDTPDIMMVRDPDSFMANYGDGSRALDLNQYAQYMPEYQARRQEYPHLSMYDTADGATYLCMTCSFDAVGEAWFANKALLDKYGLDVPANWNEMKNAMEVVCAAEDDVTGVMFYPWDFGYSYLCYASIFGTMGLYPTDMAYNSEKESWYFALTEYEDAYRQATESMAEGYSKGWINADFMAWGDKYDTIILNGDWLFNFSYCDETKLKQTDAEVVAMPAPAADGVTPYASTAYVSDVTGWNCMISSDTEYPEICAQIIELITSEDFANHMYWGFEGETYTVDSDGNRSYTQEYLDLDSDAQAAVWGIGRNPPYFVDPYVSSFYIGDAKVINASDVGRENMRDVDAKLNSGEYVTYVSQYTPNFDDYTQEDVSNALGTIKTYVTESLTNFVLGNTPMTEWDSFMDGLSAYGDVDTIVEAYNAAEQRPARATQSERTYLIP